ncbi:MAG: class I SAM-dependent methyltransferase [Candidatus Eiseniibacteriota bacterium]|jgi:SAM-dependent methyltransferase
MPERDDQRDAPETRRREARFHDAWAAELVDPAATPVRECFEAPFAQENRFILRLLGDLTGCRLLDVGCGPGESAVYFALRGARVTAADVSPAMLGHCQAVARYHGTTVTTLESPAEALALPDASFDVVYAANVLHHVTDQERALAEFRRVLVPGGIVVTWDPLAYNPVINIYRRMADRVRSADEAPLDVSILRVFERHFTGVRHREFWLLGLAIFLKYYLVDRVHPNEERYWRRILGPHGRTTVGIVRGLMGVDRALLRLPLLGRLAWNTVIWGRRPDDTCPGAPPVPAARPSAGP